MRQGHAMFRNSFTDFSWTISVGGGEIKIIIEKFSDDEIMYKIIEIIGKILCFGKFTWG